jgi:glycerol-3-phosphate dehydrogenase (NAD(P)+)
MVGERLGRGESLAEILSTMNSVAEGVATSRAVAQFAERQEIDMPICTQVYRVLFEGATPQDATDHLMSRPVREE